MIQVFIINLEKENKKTVKKRLTYFKLGFFYFFYKIKKISAKKQGFPMFFVYLRVELTAHKKEGGSHIFLFKSYVITFIIKTTTV